MFRTSSIFLTFCLVLTSCVGVSETSPRGVDALARDVSRAESVRSIKTLQRLYAQYAQFGLWKDVGNLFAEDATFTFDGLVKEAVVSRGAEGISGFLRERYGNGHEGMRQADVHTLMIEAPLVRLSADGRTAKARWYALNFTGGDGEAAIEGGIFVNDYVLDNSTWKIAAAHYYPMYYGPYEKGWTNWGGGQLPVAPYFFTPDTAGVPIPAPEGPPPAARTSLAELTRRIAALNAEDQVRNLQAAYGYYADRKMWSDVIDLFDEDGLVEDGGKGIWTGKGGVRRWLASIGPEGLAHGEVNDGPQFDVTVEIAPGGNEAWARGIELRMLGQADREQGWWEVAAFRNRFVRDDGVWKIRELRRFPLFKSDYYLGWGKSRIVENAPDGANAPSMPVPSAEAIPPGLAMPAFLGPHPVSGRPVTGVSDARLVAANALSGPVARGATARLDLAEARRRLALSTGYDGVENVSSAYTYYLDDYQSQNFGALLAEQGFKMSAFAGYYIGRDRVTEAGRRVWGEPPTMRDGVHFHWRPQPIIMVAPDGRSANVRVRLFQPRTGKEVGERGAWYGANFMTGMYHDQFVLEDGVWRFWNLSLDEPYVSTVSWKLGWAKAKDPVEKAGGSASVLVASNSDFPPDVPVKTLGKRQKHFRGGTGDPLQWPSILPMWFEYTNPVSGRLPEHYQADCPPCTVRPDLRLDHHGYMQPPDLKELNRRP